VIDNLHNGLVRLPKHSLLATHYYMVQQRHLLYSFK